MRTCWAALVVGATLGLAPRVLPPSLAFLGLPLELAATTLAYGALYRAAFGGPAGWKGLRWGVQEWRLLAVQALVTLILTVVMAVLAVLVGAVVVGVAKSNAPGLDITSVDAWRGALDGPGALVAGLPPLLSMVIMLWLFLRLSLAPAATIDLDRIQVLSAFGRTRGVVLVLAAAGAVLAAPAVILVVVIGYLRAIAGFSEGALIPELVSVALVFFYLIPVWAAALVDVYRLQPAPPPGTLRT
ncbi:MULTISPECIES: hypothetical protein [unclassified Caulobacter]|uniref:hypothetical protein n=1 Tax=unclassified Caulobacter TaxID=2648921 RepID=UPI001F3FA9DF|nr:MULTISPECIES: hypothetical protein [unclassified Caulobacter]